MNIDLASLTPGTQHFSGDEEIMFEDVDGNENKINCHVELSVRKTNDAIYVHADLVGEVSTPCHKCLEPANCRVEPSFDVIFRVTGLATEASESSGDEDLIFVSPDENRVSLDEQIYENLIVNMPIRIVCKDDCKGLCSQCGANLNFKQCECTEDIDPRWEALRKMKDDLSEK